MPHGRKFGLGLILSVFCLAYAFWETDWTTLGRILGEAALAPLVIALVLQALQLIFKGRRWQLLLAPFGKTPYGEVTLVYVVGLMVNDVLPAKLGELTKSYLVNRRYLIPLTPVLSTVVFERFLDVLTVLGMLGYLVVGGLAPRTLAQVDLFQAAVLVMGVMGLLLLVPLVIRVGKETFLTWSSKVEKLLPETLQPWYHRLATGVLAGMDWGAYGWKLLNLTGHTLAAWALIVWSTLYIFRGLHIDRVTVEDCLLVIVITSFGMMVPSSPGYIGTFHALAIETLVWRGYGLPSAQAAAILMHLSWFLPEVILGGLAAPALSLSWRDLEKVRKESP